jgi:DNA-binding response OmpR family regulator
MKPVILVVDDDIAMGELLSDVLGAHAFEVLSARPAATRWRRWRSGRTSRWFCWI